jgi:protein-disulfide isomerase
MDIIQKNIIYIGAFILGISIFFNIYLWKEKVTSTTLTSQLLDELPENIPVLGNEDATLTVVEFADFQCPICTRFHVEGFSEFKSGFIDTGKVKFVFADFAFMGQESKDAAEAANCAHEQGKFWEYHNQLFSFMAGEDHAPYTTTILKQFGNNIGLNSEKFESCLNDSRYDQIIANNLELGKKYGVIGTPTIFIGNQIVNGLITKTNLIRIVESQLTD